MVSWRWWAAVEFPITRSLTTGRADNGQQPEPRDTPSLDEVLAQEADFASEHSRTSTSEAVSSGEDHHSGRDIPHGLGGMDMKRRRLLD